MSWQSLVPANANDSGRLRKLHVPLGKYRELGKSCRSQLGKNCRNPRAKNPRQSKCARQFSLE
jgi:hypothetical protein